MTRDELQRQVDEDRAAIARAQEESRRIADTLKAAKRVRRDSLIKLRLADRLR